MAIVGQSIGPQLLKALGLEGQRVHGIDIRVRAREAVTITVEKLMADIEARQMAKVLEDYTLMPRSSIINDFDGWFSEACAKAGVS